MAAYDIEKDIGPRVQIIQEIHELILAGEDEPVTMAGFFMPARRVLRVIVCRIAGANKQNSLSVMAGKGSNLWARSFLACTNPAALTCLLNVLVHLT